MIYIGWSGALAEMIFFRRSLLALAAAALLAGIVMLVAHMSFVNPQITNLVPVLKSYWLSIHVSVITASYEGVISNFSRKSQDVRNDIDFFGCKHFLNLVFMSLKERAGFLPVRFH